MNSTKSRNETLYFTVATAGHVDHGKTSLLRALTGTDPDRLKEEKQRGLTTDLGFAHLTLQSENAGSTIKIGFVDVPGHGKFLKNMLAGVGGIDLALLVVAADEGPMPQTEQHAKILSLLGVKQVILVLTKIDIASAEQKQAAEIQSLKLIHEFDLNCSAVLPVSATTNVGVDKISPALMSILRRDIDRTDQVDEPVYLPIDRVFSKTGFGTVITGTLVRGTLRTGENVCIEPGDLTARVRGMESFSKPVEQAHAGQRLAVNLVLKQAKALARGQAIFLSPPTACQNLIARFNLFKTDSADDFLKTLPGQQLRIYHGTGEGAGHLRWLERIDTENGAELVGQISLTSPLIAEPGEHFVVRYGDTGVTGGEILIGVRARWLSRKKLMPLVKLILDGNFIAAVDYYIESSPHRLIKEDAILAILPLPQRVMLASQIFEGKLIALGEYVSTLSTKEALLDKMLGLLLELEEEASSFSKIKSDDGITLETLRAKTLGTTDRGVFQFLVKALLDTGKATKSGDKLVSSKSTESKLAARDSEDVGGQSVLNVLRQQPCLETKEIARLLNMQLKEVEVIIARLGKKGQATLVAYEFASTIDEIGKAHAALAQIWQAKREISPSDFKEKLNVSRKYAMALLTYFDDHSITRRVANNRVLLKAPKN